ncbi:scavenger receptor cysteine-rich domain-containing protein DMBT1-like [Amphiura filiformis]|uniref:scavenger receptor cysteine-rich domain-containing protein DMBT1-like n=1 Tax=Amphiura filiformis TaxID=82378 RepID=UPI003B21F204
MGFQQVTLLLCLGCLVTNVIGQACDSVLTEETGTIVSPNYPGSYPSQSDCTIYISVPEASSMQVVFNFFSVENNYDFLYYGVGQNNDVGRAIGSLTGNSLPDPIDFRVGVVWFRFTSDSSVQYDGFSLTYTTTIESTPVPTTVTTVYTTRNPLPSLPPATGEPIIGLSLYCEANGMVAVFDKDATTTSDATDVHLINENCVGQDYGDNQIGIQTDYNKCGTTMEETTDHIIFRNNLLFGQADPNSPIIKDRELNVTLECRMERRRLAMSDSLQLVGSTFEFTQVSYGNFTYYLEIYQDGSFAVPYDPVDYPVAVNIGRDLFMAGRIDTTGDDLELFIDTCWGTPSSDPLDATNYTIIDSGCAVDESVQFYDSGNPVMQQFSFHAFAFQTGDPLVYLHCEMLVCDLTNPSSRCQQGCVPSIETSARDLHVVSSHGPMALASSN